MKHFEKPLTSVTFVAMDRAQDILSELKKGSEKAYKRLFHGYFSDLVLFAASLVKDRAAAEDLVQEFFIAFWMEKRYMVIVADLEGYLYRSMRNSCLNYLRDEGRKRAREAEMEREVFAPEAPDAAEYEREREEIWRAIHRLPPQCKEIFLLCTLKEMKYREAAEKLGVSINTVRTQMGRAFRFLREELKGRTFTALLVLLARARAKIEAAGE